MAVSNLVAQSSGGSSYLSAMGGTVAFTSNATASGGYHYISFDLGTPLAPGGYQVSVNPSAFQSYGYSGTGWQMYALDANGTKLASSSVSGSTFTHNFTLTSPVQKFILKNNGSVMLLANLATVITISPGVKTDAGSDLTNTLTTFTVAGSSTSALSGTTAPAMNPATDGVSNFYHTRYSNNSVEMVKASLSGSTLTSSLGATSNPSMWNAVSGFTLSNSTMLYMNGFVYSIGGEYYNGGAWGNVSWTGKYNIANNTWSTVAQQPQSPTAWRVPIPISSTVAWFSGGYSNADGWGGGVITYDTSGNTWAVKTGYTNGTVSVGGQVWSDATNANNVYQWGYMSFSQTTNFWTYNVSGNSLTSSVLASAVTNSTGNTNGSPLNVGVVPMDSTYAYLYNTNYVYQVPRSSAPNNNNTVRLSRSNGSRIAWNAASVVDANGLTCVDLANNSWSGNRLPLTIAFPANAS